MKTIVSTGVIRTWSEWVGILNVVFEPESISVLEVTKLSSKDAGEGGSEECPGC